MAVSTIQKTSPSTTTISVTSASTGGYITIPSEYKDRWINIYSTDYRYGVLMYSNVYGRVLKIDGTSPTRADGVTFNINIVYI